MPKRDNGHGVSKAYVSDRFGQRARRLLARHLADPPVALVNDLRDVLREAWAEGVQNGVLAADVIYAKKHP